MNQLASIPATQTFGTLLKHWRLARRMSQLALALEAEEAIQWLAREAQGPDGRAPRYGWRC